MTPTITSEIVEAYCLCPTKAFLLLTGDGNTTPHDYVRITAEQEAANRKAHWSRLEGTKDGRPVSDLSDLVAVLAAGKEVLVDSVLTAQGMEARCDVLKIAKERSRLGDHSYEPVKVIGTHRIAAPQVIGLAYLGHVLGQVQGCLPAEGTLVRLGDRPCKVKLAGRYREVRRIVDALRTWTQEARGDAPPLALNKHCPYCPFRDACLQQAEREDNLSLLGRMTLPLMRKYQGKGISTVNQLSHLFKPRRTRRKGRRPVRHNLELQALAIRTDKIYVDHLPDLPRGQMEMYVDVEGIPDRGCYYLIGLLVCRGGEPQYLSFWANNAEEEKAIWSAFVDQIEALPDAPLYHYGSYDRKAFETLASRYDRGRGLARRLVNVASCVYGKVYFPVRSNSLKVLGRFLGATWTSPEASGVQSLVWRHRWEATRDEQHMRSIVQYNREDCEAVRLVVDRLARIGENASSDSAIDFAHRPKQHATEAGKDVHRQFEQILKYAWAGSDEQGIRIRVKDAAEGAPRKKGAPKGHQAYNRLIPSKAGRTVTVASKRRCPHCRGRLVLDDTGFAEKTVIDLVFTRNGCRKVITRYMGKKGYCPNCDSHCAPPSLNRLYKQSFGHGFHAWVVYLRIVLRLPYRIITQVLEHLFGVGLSSATIINFLRHLAGHYQDTEAAILQAILKSDFVHVDETRINIQGTDSYVWVFTDGRHVIFRLTETREANIVHEVLSGYTGVLVSDFYLGYDSVPCRQQKCLVHVIRDLNDDLWKAPFNAELEAFALEARSLLVPILEEIERYGLKARHLRKFSKPVERFYERNIDGREYTSELAVKYQKRFQRYRDSLFTFLGQDGIPWNNNMAERAIRQLAVQRKISGTFFKQVAPQYLLLLAIAQTCRFQDKSFLKFLLSKSTDVDAFRRSRPIRYSAPVG